MSTHSKKESNRLSFPLSVTHFLTPWGRVLLKKLRSSKLVKKFHTIYGIRGFITAFTSARHLSLSWATSIQSVPSHRTSWRFILILVPIYAWVFQMVSFPQTPPPKTLYTPLFSHIRATYSAYLFLLDLIIRKVFGGEYRSLSSSLCSFLHFVATLSFLDPNIFLTTLFSNTLSLSSSLSLSDQVSHPYKTKVKIINLYILIFILLVSNVEDKRFCIEWYQAIPDINLLLISS